MKSILPFAFIVCLLASIDASAQWTQMGSGLQPIHSSPSPAEGQEVAISADGMTMATVCAYYHSRSDSSPVIMYRRNGMQWQMQQVIFAGLGDDLTNYRSTLSLSANGNTLAVYNSLRALLMVYANDGSSWRVQARFNIRAPHGNANSSYQGLALSYDGNTVLCNGQIFVRVGGAWSIQQTLIPLDRPVASNPGFQGYADTAGHFSVYTSSAISADGNTAVVCDNYGPDTTYNLWVFTRNGSLWTQQGSRLEATQHENWSSSGIITAPDISISGDGNTIAMNSSAYGGWGIWVFKKIGSVWTEQTTTPLGEPQHLTIGRNVNLAYDGNSFITATNQGIFLYRNTGGTWHRVGTHSTFIGVDSLDRIFTGRSISDLALDSSGTNAIFGTSQYQRTRGAEYYFTLTDSTWSQTGPAIWDSIDAAGSELGFSIAISSDGSTVASGGYTDGGSEGAVWVYRRNGQTWSQFGPKLWVHDQHWQPRNFGYSVALSGDGSTLAVGAPNSNNFTGNFLQCPGSIYIYTRSGNTYVPQIDSLIMPGATALGYHISISDDGNTLLASAGDSGAVVFVRNGNVWSKQTSFSTIAGSVTVALSGDGNTAAIGDVSANNQVGGVSVYHRSGNSWTQQVNALKPASITVSGYYYPSALSISPDGGYVAATSYNINNGNGNIFCYVRNGSTWSVRDSVAPVTGGNYDQHGFGVSISATGDTISEIQEAAPYYSSGINIFTRTGGHWVLNFTMPSAPLEYYGRNFGALAATPDARYVAVGIIQNVNDLDGEVRVFKSSALLDSLVNRKDATCAQVPNGKIVVKLTGGSQPYNYAWSNGGPNVDSIVNLAPGTYTLTMSDNSGDTIVRSYNIAATVVPARSGYSYTFNCSTGRGTVQISSTGGTAPYTYVWNTGPVQTTNPAVNLQPGFYTYVATDSNGCTYTDSASVPATPYRLDISGTQPECANNGSITATMPGGTAPFTYTWNTTANTSLITGLGSGTYTITIADANNCVVTGSYTLTQSCSSVIEGNVFFDHNGNCQFDALTDHRAPNLTMVAAHGGYNVYGSTDASGNYSILTPDSGAFNVTIGSLVGCDVVLCTGHNYPVPVTINHAGDTVSNVDLAVDIHNYNLWLQAALLNEPFPGSSFDFNLYYGDLVDSLVPNGTITLSYDSLLTFSSSNPAYTTLDAVNHLITWNVTGISLYNTQHISLHFTAPANDPIHVLTTLTASITPTAGDCNLYNNTVVMPVWIAGSLDPNYKEASPSGALYPEDTVITYTIHFQNTGADSTHFIEVIDTLSDYVDAGSVRTVATSHYPYTFTISGKGILDWKFNPLALPDSGTDYANSQGFIIYQVFVHSGLPIGTQVKNSASIYFDYNTPVMTNTTVNTVSLPNGITNISSADANVSVFPNPFSSSTKFNIAGNIEKYDISIKDVLGRSVAEFANLSGSSFTFNRGNLAPGCYMYNVISKDKIVARGKLVVE